MLPIRWKMMAALLTVGLLGTGTSILLSGSAAEQPPAAATDQSGDPVPAGALTRLGTQRWRHNGSVHYLGFAAQGKELLTVGEDAIFRVWDVKTGKELRRFGKGAGMAQVNDIILIEDDADFRLYWGNGRVAALAPDGRTLATAGRAADTIDRYEVATGKELPAIKIAKNSAGNLLFSADSKSLWAAAGDGVVCRYDMATGKEVQQLGKPAEERRRGRLGIALSPDGKLLATVGIEVEDNVARSHLRIWDLAAGKELHALKMPRSRADAVLFSPDSRRLAWAGGRAGQVLIYDVASGKELTKLEPGRNLDSGTSMVFTPDGNALAVKCSDQVIRLLDLESGEELRRFGEPLVEARLPFRIFLSGGGVQSHQLALSPDGTVLAAVGGSQAIRLWDLESGKELNVIAGHRSAVSTVAVSPDGKTVTTHGSDNTIRQWDAVTGRELRCFPLPDASATVLFSPSGARAAVFGSDNAIRLFDTATGKELHKLPLPEAQGPLVRFTSASLNGMAFSPDGMRLAARDEAHTIHIWDVGSGKELRSMRERRPEPENNDGTIILSIGGTIPGIAFGPNGIFLASIDDGRSNNALRPRRRDGIGDILHLWRAETGAHVGRIELPRGTVSVAFAPDGRTVATINPDQTVSLWELATGKERCQLKAAAAVLAYSPNGRVLVTGGTDQVLHAWDVATGKELAQLKGHHGAIRTLCFAADGTRLISGSGDTTALIWGASQLCNESCPAATELEARQVAGFWTELAGPDGRKAHTGIWALAQAPEQALPWLREHLKPVADVEPQRLQQLLADLAGDKFAVRQAAVAELEKLGDLAEPDLAKVLAGQPSLELRQRVEQLLGRLSIGQAPPPDTLRAMRVVEVLEQMASAEAREVLAKLAKGAAGARLTREAQASLDRLTRRAAPNP
jgi:WD40 repeat protein